MGVEKTKGFIIEEYPGEGDLGELIAISVAEYINQKAGTEVLRLKAPVKKATMKVLTKFDNTEFSYVKLRG